MPKLDPRLRRAYKYFHVWFTNKKLVWNLSYLDLLVVELFLVVLLLGAVFFLGAAFLTTFTSLGSLVFKFVPK